MLSLFSQFIFGNSGLFSNQISSSSPSSKDKNLYFDLRSSELNLELGEQLIACFFPLEDVKGNPDELGLIKVTNLRLIWVCCNKKRVNLSIGWRTVSLAFEQNLKNSFGSSVTSLCVLCKYESTKYEFVFNKMPAYDHIWNGQVDSIGALEELQRALGNDKTLTASYLTPMYLVDPFEVVFNVWQAYKRTHLFRHCRSNLTDLFTSSYLSQVRTKSPTRTDEINRLPGEQIIDAYDNIIQSETRLVKYTGTLILTNVRIIWVDDVLLLRNLSIPYIRIETIKTKQSDKLILNTLDYLATSNQIEFRGQRSSDLRRTRQIFEQVQNLYSLYESKPKYGPECCEECIELMQYLRPIETYTGSSSALTKLENLGSISNLGDDEMLVTGGYKETGKSLMDEQEQEQTKTKTAEDQMMGEQLTEYCMKLNSYLDELPIEQDQEVVYSEELGLAIERPKNGLELERIWKIDPT